MNNAANTTIYTETTARGTFKVIRRPSGTVQVWAYLAAGESCGWPECMASGTIEDCREWWKVNIMG